MRLCRVFFACAMAALAWPSSSLARGPVPASSAQHANAKKAQELFVKGVGLFEKKKFADALEAFRASYAEVASPNSHLYIARCLAQTGDLKGAWAELGKVIDEAAERAKTEADYEQTRQEATKERDEISAKLAIVTIRIANADDATTVKLGGVVIPREQWGSAIVAPTMGAADLVVESRAKGAFKLPLTLTAGEKRDVAFDVLTPPPDAVSLAPPSAATTDVESAPTPRSGSTSGLRIASFVAGGVGVVGLVVFAIEGASASSTFSDLKSSCAGPCPADDQSKIDSGKSAQHVANVGLVVGALGVATGVTLFVLSTRHHASAAASGPRITRVGVGPAALNVAGTF